MQVSSRAFVLLVAVLAACSAEHSRPTDSAAHGGGTGGARALGGGGAVATFAGGASAPPLPLAGRASASDIDASTATDGATSCATAEYEAKLRPLDMVVLLDQSGSMTEHEDRWTPVTSAIKRFVNAPESAGMGIGLQYFPLAGDEDVKCAGKTYAQPAVAVATLPGNAKAVVESIDAHYFTKDNCCDASEHQGTPTRPAMDGVIEYTQSWLAAHPERDAVILLATDGEPSKCDDNDVDDVSKVIAAAAAGTPSIKTYVIGIGDNDNLSDLAKAGGTGQDAFVVDGTGGMTEVQLLETLAKIRGATLRCDFDVPSSANSDPGNVNVQRATSGTSSTLVKVPQASDCAKATAGGWYYDSASARIQLCPDACREVLAAPAAKVNIVVGCAAVVLL
jgi:hypothetical protein